MSTTSTSMPRKPLMIASLAEQVPGPLNTNTRCNAKCGSVRPLGSSNQPVVVERK